MAYEKREDLPASLREWLPEEAQDLYLKVYNESWNSYQEEEGGELGRDSVANRDAMAAVRREFVEDQTTHEWHRRGEQPKEAEKKEGLIEKVTHLFEHKK
jgi:cation transport regulator ChaB